MMPLAFTIHAASMLTLLGTPINVIALGAAQNAGGSIIFVEFGIIGITLVAGSIVIILLIRTFVLPEKNGDSMPPDCSGYAATLLEQYRLDDGLHHLHVHEGSPLVGRNKAEWARGGSLVLKAIQDPATFAPIRRDELAVGDILKFHPALTRHFHAQLIQAEWLPRPVIRPLPWDPSGAVFGGIGSP